MIDRKMPIITTFLTCFVLLNGCGFLLALALHTSLSAQRRFSRISRSGCGQCLHQYPNKFIQGVPVKMILISFFFFFKDHCWIQKNQGQVQRFMTKSFLDEILTHLIKVDVLSLADKIKIKETGGLCEQVGALISVASGKEKGSDILFNFIKASDSQAAQLILLHGNTTLTQQSLCQRLFLNVNSM